MKQLEFPPPGRLWWGLKGTVPGAAPEAFLGGLPAAAVTCSVFSLPHQVVWQWKMTQAVCQALRGKKGFPVLGAGLEPSKPPACRCVAYTFCAEGRLCQATYEGEWCWGRPHGR